MENISPSSERNPQQDHEGSTEILPDQNPEKLPHSIKVFRTMSSTELSKFLDGEKMRPIVEKSEDNLQDITTADSSAIWFTPDRAEYSSKPRQDDDSLVPDDLTKLDFKDVQTIWPLGRGGVNDPGTNNLIVEFLTDRRPQISYGKYNDYWVKEYTYPEYDKANFQIQRIYKLSEGKVIFDRMQAHDYDSAEEKLKEVAFRELEEEQWMEQEAISGIKLIKEHAAKLPSPYSE